MRAASLRAADVLSAVSAAAIVMIGLITCGDVLGRYFLGSPLRGGHEVLDMLTCLTIFPALPRLCLQRAHISVDLIDGFISARTKHVLLRVVDIVCALALLVVAYRMSVYAEKIRGYGVQTLLLHIPLYPYAYLVSAMAVLAALACVVSCFSPVRTESAA